MSQLNLIILFSLFAIATGHLPIDGAKDRPYKRIPVNTNDIDLNYHRSLQQEKEFQLQLAWWNWNFCTNAYPNASFTPRNALVPRNTVFLANYPTFLLDNSPDTCKSKTTTRTGTISAGQQTIFFPVVAQPTVDWDDDWQKGCVAFPNETAAARLSSGEFDNVKYSNATFKEKTYLTIDGENVSPVYLYDTTVYYLSACEDNRTYEEYSKLLNVSGDSCDFEPFQAIGGLDIGPMVGYYGIDTRTWVDGESHTFEFGSLNDLCIATKYVITANAPTKAPTQAPVDCAVTWRLFNSQSNQFVANLTNGTIVSTPPPCRRTNIEAVVPCGFSNGVVVLELYQNNKRIHRRVEAVVPYFLYGNNGANVFDGRIAPGTYRIRVEVNGAFSPFTTFTFLGPRCN